MIVGATALKMLSDFIKGDGCWSFEPVVSDAVVTTTAQRDHVVPGISLFWNDAIYGRAPLVKPTESTRHLLYQKMRGVVAASTFLRQRLNSLLFQVAGAAESGQGSHRYAALGAQRPFLAAFMNAAHTKLAGWCRDGATALGTAQGIIGFLFGNVRDMAIPAAVSPRVGNAAPNYLATVDAPRSRVFGSVHLHVARSASNRVLERRDTTAVLTNSCTHVGIVHHFAKVCI